MAPLFLPISWAILPAKFLMEFQRTTSMRIARMMGSPANNLKKVTSEITLLYVDPVARHQGLRTKLLEALERRLFCAGCPKTFLWWTETARVFYAFRGYVKIEDGHPTKMEKADVLNHLSNFVRR